MVHTTRGQSAQNTTAPDAQILKLQSLISQLERGKDVTPEQLDRVGLREAYNDEWRYTQQRNDELVMVPYALDDYVRLLKVADAYETAADKSGKVSTRNKAEAAYGEALEELQTVLASDPYARMYLDRDVCFDAGHEPGLTAEGVPRAFNSQSHHRQSCMGLGYEKMGKRDAKWEVLNTELSKLQPPVHAPLPPEAQKRIERLLGHKYGQ